MIIYTEEELNTPINEKLFNKFIEGFNEENISRVKNDMLSVLEIWAGIKEKFVKPGISKIELIDYYTNLKKYSVVGDRYMAYVLEHGSKIFGSSKPHNNNQIKVYKNNNNCYSIYDGKIKVKDNATKQEAAESKYFNDVVGVFNIIFGLTTKSDNDIGLVLDELVKHPLYKSYIAKQFLYKAVVLEFCLYDRDNNFELNKEVKYPLINIYQAGMLNNVLNLLNIDNSDNYFRLSNSIVIKYLAIINYWGKRKDKQWIDLTTTPLVIQRMSEVLWSWDYSSAIDATYINDGTVHYWLYSPDENASNWDELYDAGIIGIGCDNIGDARQYDSQENIENARRKNEDSAQNVNAKELWQFANEMKQGDIVFAKNGSGLIIGKGEVTSDYLFDEERDELKHIRKVKWINKGEWENPCHNIISTLTEITSEDAEKINVQFKDNLQFKNPFSWTLYESKNMILHGAPGTGKSYLAKQIATDIVSNGECQDYSKLSEDLKNQIEFVQFHPNYDYSDFVEGLRPTKPNEDGTIGFELQPGIFSLFIDRARTNYENSLKTLESIEKEISVQVAINDFLSNLDLGSNNFKISSGNEFKIVGFDGRYIKIVIPGNESANKLSLRVDELRRLLESDKQFTKPGDLTAFFGKTWTEQGFSYYLVLYNIIKAKINGIKNSKNNKTVKKNFVFIIDEINRGEISKIFGELFYAVDPGYRGRNGEISTQYSNMHQTDTKFYIPDNVYIIGTMNDIDRSVDSFDFAMRRRFRFVELRASEQLEMLCELSDDVKNEAIVRMDQLNKAIVEVEGLNENYQIGPAYFLKLKDLKPMGDLSIFDRLWNDYLKPLLQEYVRGMYREAEILTKLKAEYYKVPSSEKDGEADGLTQN